MDIGDLVVAGQTHRSCRRRADPGRPGRGGARADRSGPTGPPGLKIADIDPRADPAACFEISDKALSVGGGVLEAILTWLNGSPRSDCPRSPSAWGLANRELVAFTGAGGKSTLMLRLADELVGIGKPGAGDHHHQNGP